MNAFMYGFVDEMEKLAIKGESVSRLMKRHRGGKGSLRRGVAQEIKGMRKDLSGKRGEQGKRLEELRSSLKQKIKNTPKPGSRAYDAEGRHGIPTRDVPDLGSLIHLRRK